MFPSKLQQNISIIIVNSSHSSIDDLTAVLRTKIESGLRPFIACMTQEMIQRAPNHEEYVREFIDEQLRKSRVAMDKSQQIESFNQLDAWKNENDMKSDKKKRRSSNRIKSGSKNQSEAKDVARNIIIDFPMDHESIELYLILFDIFDYGLVKELCAMSSSSKVIVNLHPRFAQGSEELSIKSEAFWIQLMHGKWSQDFDDVAFVDLDVPVESPYMLNLRSTLIYDQFCHFFYDLEDIKSRFKNFNERLEMVEVNSDGARDDLNGLRNRLDRIPRSMMTVEAVYEAMLDQVSAANGSRDSSAATTEPQPFQVELFQKTFSDANDEWREAFDESPQFYAAQVETLKNSLHFWDEVGSVTIEKRQLLNHFMEKLTKDLSGKGAFDDLEFYFYVLHFKMMPKSSEFGSFKKFHETRSVGTERHASREVTKAAISDYNVDYKNHARVPEDIAQLIDDTWNLRDNESNKNFHVRMFSPSAMVQLLARLTKLHENFDRRHFQLMDAMLIKFHKRAAPEMFATRTFSTALPTPLCFRDFNDYVKHELKFETGLAAEVNDLSQGDVCPVLGPKDFLLTSSIKHKRMEKPEDSVYSVLISREADAVEKAVERNLLVYNVSNKRIQFDLTESEFNSVRLNAKASTFNWLNHRKILDFSCQLHDVLLSTACDFNELETVTLTDNMGMRCSLEMNQDASQPDFFSRWNISISLSNGVVIRNLKREAVEQLRGEKQSEDGEMKRILFANGFVMIVKADGTRKLFSSNGTAFELNLSSEEIVKPQKDLSDRAFDAEATKLHQDSIASLHFLKDVDFTSFKMIVPSGEAFIVEHDVIVEKLETIRSKELNNRRTGSLHITREDGVKILHTNDFTKCLLADGTLITTWLRDDSITTVADDPEVNTTILDEIWLTEAENESQFVVRRLLNHISDDYFLNVSRSHQFEHRRFGSVRFDGGVKIEMPHGPLLEAHHNRFSMIMDEDVTCEIDDTQIRLTGGLCSECNRIDEVLVNFPNVNEDDGEVALVTAHDTDGNTFEVKKSGRHAFYASDTYKTRICSQCSATRRKVEAETFDERWFAINRDYSGYEITSTQVGDESVFECPRIFFGNHEEFDFPVNEAEVNIDSESKARKASTVDDVKPSSIPSPTTKSPRESSSSLKKRKKKSISMKSVIAQPLIKEMVPSPWLTPDPSIAEDISAEHKSLIEFYANPLNEFPASLAVGLTIKLNQFNLLAGALLHLKKFSNEKFIFNSKRLMETPIGKMTFPENFENAVRKTVEQNIHERLKTYQQLVAEAVIEDLLDACVNKKLIVMEIPSEDSIIVDNSDTHALPVKIKSFSFS